MRPLPLVLLVIFLLMAAQQCHGCGDEFVRISSHMERCDRVIGLLQGGLKRRMDRKEDREARKLAKRQKQLEQAEAARLDEARKAAEVRARQEVC